LQYFGMPSSINMLQLSSACCRFPTSSDRETMSERPAESSVPLLAK